jgi:hypothetical protein
LNPVSGVEDSHAAPARLAVTRCSSGFSLGDNMKLFEITIALATCLAAWLALPWIKDRIWSEDSMLGKKAGEVREIGGIKFVWCPPTDDLGFFMGSPTDEEERDDDEEQHRVILSQGYWIAKTETTQKQ